MSSLKSKLGFSNSDSSDSDDSSDKYKYYKLRITAGPDYDKSKQRLLVPNGSAVAISPSTSLLLRIKSYAGFPSRAPSSSPYFDLPAHSKDTFSISFSFVPPHDIPAADLLFGIDTGHNPIRKFKIPGWLVDKAVSIVTRVVDQSLSADVQADQPWLAGPAVAGSTTTYCFGDEGADPAVLEKGFVEGATSEAAAKARRENGIPDGAGERRKYFNSQNGLEKTILGQGKAHYFDFANGYIDWKKYAIKLPLLSVPVLKFVGAGKAPETQEVGGSHKVRFFLKNRKTGEMYFVIMAVLTTGRELGDAMKEDEEATQQLGAHGTS